MRDYLLCPPQADFGLWSGYGSEVPAPRPAGLLGIADDVDRIGRMMPASGTNRTSVDVRT